MLVVDWHSANPYWNFVTGFVMNKAAGFRRTGGFDGSRQRTFFTAEFATGMIAMQERLSDAGFSDHFMAPVTSDALSPVAPKDEFFLHVDNAQAGWQAFQNGAADFGIVEKTHASGSVRTCYQLYRQNAYGLQVGRVFGRFYERIEGNYTLSITYERWHF